MKDQRQIIYPILQDNEDKSEVGSLKIAIIACDIFQKELDMLVNNDPHVVHKEYLEFALHDHPEELKARIIEKVNALIGKVDAIFLGYAVCQSLKGIVNEIPIPSAMLDADDCISVFLTPSEYAKEKEKCPGTWFNSPKWAELGIEGANKEMHLDCLKDQGFEPIYFLKLMFEGYERCLFIDTGVPDRERWELLSKQFADQLELRHECCSCDLRMLEQGLANAKMKASNSKRCQIDDC